MYIIIDKYYWLLLSVQIKAISSEWLQSSTPIVLAGQLMSLLSDPRQRSSSSHVRVVDEAREKLYREKLLYKLYRN